MTRKTAATQKPAPELPQEPPHNLVQEPSEFPEIESDVPIPKSRGGGRTSKLPYRWEDMKPGQSYFIPTEPHVDNISNIQTAARKRVPEAKWVTRRFPAEGGFRIWRK